MTIQMAIGRLIVQKIVGQPEKWPEDVVEQAQIVINNFDNYDSQGRLSSNSSVLWHVNGYSWVDFKNVAARHNIDLPAILQEEEKQ